MCIRLLLLLLLVGCGRPTPEAPPTDAAAPTEAPAPAGSYRDADLADLEAKLPGVHLLDVRSQGEFDRGHVAGARLLPTAELPKRLGELEEWRGEEIWLICQSGGRSARAGQLLKEHGFDVVNVRGGTGAWIASGRPVD